MSTVLATVTASAAVATTAPAAAAAAAAENLDERMERIRRRNAELELKHREAEADRLAALRNNAMVVPNRPAAAGDGDDDEEEDGDGVWPRAHRYDDDDDDDDAQISGQLAGIKVQPLADSTTATVATSEDDAAPTVAKGPGGRDYKKFADGEGPPPDPKFNFLADDQRDDRQQRRSSAKAMTTPAAERNSNKDWRQQHPDDNSAGGGRGTRGGLNGSFKQQRTDNNNTQRAAAAAKANNRPARPATSDGDTEWKKERQSIDEARIGRQKTGDGRWRREWDSEKVIGRNGEPLVPQRVDNSAGASNLADAAVAAPTTAAAGRRIVNNNSTVAAATVEKQRGEVKSVKLPSTRPIGSGRIVPRGPLPLKTPVVLPSSTHEFTASAVLAPPFTPSLPSSSTATVHHQTPVAFASPPQPHPYYSQSKPLLPHQAAPLPLQPAALPIYIQPTPTVYFNGVAPAAATAGIAPLPLAAAVDVQQPSSPIVRTARPNLNLQSRLQRHRQPPAAAAAETTG